MKIIHSIIPSSVSSYFFAQPKEDIVFFDIETTGLSPKASSLYLIGAMNYDTIEQNWILTQWFADDYRSEAKIITSFLEYLKPFRALYHFNGSMFDIPYVLAKCEKHQLTIPNYCESLFYNKSHHWASTEKKQISIDLLKEIRPLKKPLHLLKANQTALERWLGFKREDRFNGGELISVYAEYMQKKILHPEEADSLEKLLLLHNHDDIAGMLRVCSFLSYKDCLQPQDIPYIHSFHQENNTLSILFSLSQNVPQPVHLIPLRLAAIHSEHTVSLSLTKDTGELTLPVIQDTLRYFLEPYQDYYYLPEEDHAIHKSVAEFVDSAYRRKATASTCYTKQKGCFIPSCSPKKTSWEEPCFYRERRAKPAFYHIREQNEADLMKQLAYYLYHELPSFL